jgi:hypothetical protein
MSILLNNLTIEEGYGLNSDENDYAAQIEQIKKDFYTINYDSNDSLNNEKLINLFGN